MIISNASECATEWGAVVNVCGDDRTPIMRCPDPSFDGEFLSCGGQTYRTTVRDGKIVMAEGLKYDNNITGCYRSNASNDVCYPWVVAVNICPEGWHLPSDSECGLVGQNYSWTSDEYTADTRAAYACNNSGNYFKYRGLPVHCVSDTPVQSSSSSSSEENGQSSSSAEVTKAYCVYNYMVPPYTGDGSCFDVSNSSFYYLLIGNSECKSIFASGSSNDAYLGDYSYTCPTDFTELPTSVPKRQLVEDGWCAYNYDGTGGGLL